MSNATSRMETAMADRDRVKEFNERHIGTSAVSLETWDGCTVLRGSRLFSVLPM